MSEKLDTSFLDDALYYVSRETRSYVADSLACYLHNDGYALDGNTEANDVEWFARHIWEDEVEPIRERWDIVGEDVQERYRRTARAVIATLPDYQLRVAHRLITLSKVVRDIERAERQQRSSVRP